MRSGEKLEGIAFFEALYADDVFCRELGRVMLAAGKLEVEITRYLESSGQTQKAQQATLGKLIGFAEKDDNLANLTPALKTLNQQRNYLAHNIYALFSSHLKESLLPKNGLLDSDIDIFSDKARTLSSEIAYLAKVVLKLHNALLSGS